MIAPLRGCIVPGEVDAACRCIATKAMKVPVHENCTGEGIPGIPKEPLSGKFKGQVAGV